MLIWLTLEAHHPLPARNSKKVLQCALTHQLFIWQSQARWNECKGSEHFGCIFTEKCSKKKQNKKKTIRVQRWIRVIYSNYYCWKAKACSPVCMTTWVTSGVTWETTTALIRLANLFTVICEWKQHLRVSLTYHGVYEMQTSPDHTCSLALSPDVTIIILAWLLSPSGLLFSLSSWPADGEPSVFGVFAAELNPTVLDVLESLGNKERNCKIHRCIFWIRFSPHLQQQPYSSLSSCCAWTQEEAHQNILCWVLVLLGMLLFK